MKTDNSIVRDFKSIKEDYRYDADIFCNDGERVSKIKEIINTRLSLVDKTIILLYVDCQSYRKLGKRFGLSHMTMRRDVLRIKRIILEEYNRMTKEK